MPSATSTHPINFSLGLTRTSHPTKRRVVDNKIPIATLSASFGILWSNSEDID